MEKVKVVHEYTTPKGLSIIIQNVRLNWVYIAKPDIKTPGKALKADDKPKYKATLLIPKADYEGKGGVAEQLNHFISGHLDVEAKWNDPSKRKDAITRAFDLDVTGSLIKDGDNYLKGDGSSYPGLSGNVFMRADTFAKEIEAGVYAPTYPLQLVGRNGVAVGAERLADLFYSGVYANVKLTLKGSEWPDADKRGVLKRSIHAYLAGIQSHERGDRIGSSGSFSQLAIDDSVPTQGNPFTSL